MNIDISPVQIVVATTGLKGDKGDPGGSEIVQVLSPLQTVWALQSAPVSPGSTKLFINGQKQRYAIDYQINGLVLSWLGYSLKPNWMIEFYYF